MGCTGEILKTGRLQVKIHGKIIETYRTTVRFDTVSSAAELCLFCILGRLQCDYFEFTGFARSKLWNFHFLLGGGAGVGGGGDDFCYARNLSLMKKVPT